MQGCFTLFDTVERWARELPEKTAFIANSEKVTFAAFLKHIEDVADSLKASGATRKDRVVIAVLNKYRFLASVVGAMRAGCVPVPVTDLGAANVLSIINDCTPAACLIDSDFPLQEFAAQNLTGVNNFVRVNNNCSSNPSPVEVMTVNPGDTALIFYTSGTTSGERKGVLITHANLAATVGYMNAVMGGDSSVVEYAVAPLNHAFGFGRFRAVLQAGGTLVFDDGIFNPAKMLSAIARHGCNTLSSVATGFIIIIEHYAAFLGDAAKKIRLIEIGSMPMEPKYKNRMLELFPYARIFMNYGLTEAMRSTLIEFGKNRERLNAVGRPSPGVEIRTVDDAGAPVKADAAGRILVKGVNLAGGYWNKESLWQAKLHDGWFETGDLGSLDREGFLTFLGRNDDVINIGGIKVTPNEIESVLRDFIQGRRFCICGIKDPGSVTGEIPVLCLEGAGAVLDLEVLRRELGGKLEEFKIPRKLFNMEAFPETRNGKIIRSKIIKIISTRQD